MEWAILSRPARCGTEATRWEDPTSAHAVFISTGFAALSTAAAFERIPFTKVVVRGTFSGDGRGEFTAMPAALVGASPGDVLITDLDLDGDDGLDEDLAVQIIITSFPETARLGRVASPAGELPQRGAPGCRADTGGCAPRPAATRPYEKS